MNKQQTAAKELSWEVASELGSELGDDTPSVENSNWSKKEQPKQKSLASYLENFGKPEVPLLQLLLDDLASELKKYREYWKKRREQYIIYCRSTQEKFKICLDFFERGLYKTDTQEPQERKQKQQELKEEADLKAGGAAYNRKNSPGTVTTPADPAKAGFARQE